MKFFAGLIPILSTTAFTIDMISAYSTQGGFLISNYYKGISTTAVAQIGSIKYDTMALAGAASVNNDTITVLRNGNFAECPIAVVNPGTYTIRGALNVNPILHVNATTHLAYQKAIINHEAGDLTVRELTLDGAAVDGFASGGAADGNGAGIRYNPGATHLFVKKVTFTNNENGMLMAPANVIADPGQWNVEVEDCTFNANGFSGVSTSVGFTHNLYANGELRLRVTRSTFTNAVSGHDFKTRAKFTLLDRVFCRGSLQGRELDTPNGSVMYAENSYFRKVPICAQGNLIGIAWETVPDTRELGYIFRNCLFENFRSVNFQNTWLTQVATANGSNGRTDNGIATVYFIDCVFLGDPVNCSIGSLDIQLVWTGGPIGPDDYAQGTIVGSVATGFGPTAADSPVMLPLQSAYDVVSSTYTYNASGVYNRPVINGPDPTLILFPPTGSSPTETP